MALSAIPLLSLSEPREACARRRAGVNPVGFPRPHIRRVTPAHVARARDSNQQRQGGNHAMAAHDPATHRQLAYLKQLAY